MAHKLTKRTLEAVAKGLKEIEARFEIEGFYTGGGASSEEELEPERGAAEFESGNEDIGTNEDDEEEDEEKSIFHREDIEVAIDEFLSQLLKQKLIRKRSGKLPSFSAVFDELFGQNHRVAEASRSFEEHIKGYFEIISYHDMEIAYNNFMEIQDLIQREIEAGSARS